MGQPFIGEIRMFAGTFAPAGHAFCDGQQIQITQNEALFTLLGTTYGGDGVNTFNLPNLQSRVPVHQGQGPGLSAYVLGQVAGTENVTLTTGQLPSHTHVTAGNSNAGAVADPTNAYWAADTQVLQFAAGPGDVSMNPASLSLSGGSLPHNNLPPVLAINFIIALFGIFPVRN